MFDLVCGRPYCNLSREPRMQYRQLPFEHPFAVLKAHPQKALYPQAVFNRARAGWSFRLLLPLQLPVLIWKALARGTAACAASAATFAAHFARRSCPAFADEIDQDAAEDLIQAGNAGPAGTAGALDQAHPARLRPRQSQADCPGQRGMRQPGASLDPGGPSAQPAQDAGRCQGYREANGAKVRLLGELSMGVHPDPEADLPTAVHDLAAGKLDRNAFRGAFRPSRQSGDGIGLPALVGRRTRLSTRSRPARDMPTGAGAAHWGRGPGLVFLRSVAASAASPSQQPALEPEVRPAAHLPRPARNGQALPDARLRPDPPHPGRTGSAHRLDGGIFYLTPEELPRLAKGRRTCRVDRQAPPPPAKWP